MSGLSAASDTSQSIGDKGSDLYNSYAKWNTYISQFPAGGESEFYHDAIDRRAESADDISAY